MHKLYDWHKKNIKRYMPKRPHKPSSHLLGVRPLPCVDYKSTDTSSVDDLCGRCFVDIIQHPISVDRRARSATNTSY